MDIEASQDMLAKANQNKSKTAASNVEFLKSQVTSIPLPPSTADVIISNCVINLVPDTEKPLVFAEMFRLLKPGGRVAVSDLLAKKDFPESVRNDVALYVGCIAGASKVEQYEGWLKEAGFGEVLVVDTGSDVNVYLQTDEEGNLVGGPCCGDGGEEEEARTRTKEEGCCGKGASEKKDGGCGKAAAEKKETCCSSGGGNDGGVMQDLKEKYKNMDLNEWVGECLSLAAVVCHMLMDLQGLTRFTPSSHKPRQSCSLIECNAFSR